MYLDHYHLNAKPFDLSPGPQFIWLGEKHEEALATLTYGITANLGFLLLTGEVGVGKTALVHRLMSNLDSSTIVAHITDPGLGTFDFFRLLAAEFKFANEFHSKGEFLIELERFLYKAHEEEKKVLLIVDEAQRLNSKLLDQIRVLSNIELSDRKLINIFFIGQPEFKEMLNANANRAIRQRIAINYHIDPLTESETEQYIHHRLKVAGATREIFNPDALHKIFEFAGGYPRAINIICDHALVTGYAFGLKSIDLDVIKECEKELSIRSDVDFRKAPFHMPAEKKLPVPSDSVINEPEPLTPRSIFGTSSILIGMCVIIGVLASFYFFWPDPLDTTPPIAQNQLAESAADPSETGSPETRLDEPSSIDEKALAQSDGENETSDETAPGNETTVTDRQPDVDEDASSPERDQLNDENQPDLYKSLAVLTPPPDLELAEQPDETPENEVATADRQPGSLPEPVAPEPNQTSKKNQAFDEEEADSTVPGVTDSQPAAPTSPGGDAKSEIASQTATQEQIDTTDRQPAADNDPAGVATDPPADNNPARNTAAIDGAAQPKASDVESEPRKDTGTQATKVPVVAATSALTAAGISKSPDKTPSPTNQGSSTTATPTDKKPATQTTQAEKSPPPPPPAPSITAKAETQLQSPAESTGSDESSDDQLGKNGLEARLLSFLQAYCSTYAARDLNAFADLFVADARENGVPFVRLLPKYERNFSLIEAIQYRIELEQFAYNERNEMIEMNGRFFLRYLPPDKKWRENSGEISMRLQEKGSSFRVQRLDYQRQVAKKE